MIAVGYVHPGRVHERFMDSMLRLQRDRDVRIISAGPATLIAPARDELLGAFLGHPGLTDCTHLLMVDTDMVFTPEDVQMLHEAGEQLVGALAIGQNADGSLFCSARMRDDAAWRPATMEQVAAAGGRLLKVDAIGMAFTMIGRDLAAQLFNHVNVKPFSSGWDGVGEDVAFCQTAAKAGYQPYLHTGVAVGHIKERVIYP